MRNDSSTCKKSVVFGVMEFTRVHTKRTKVFGVWSLQYKAFDFVALVMNKIISNCALLLWRSMQCNGCVRPIPVDSFRLNWICSVKSEMRSLLEVVEAV